MGKLKFSREPAVWVTTLQALITIAVAWGLAMTEAQIIALFAGLATVSGFLIRSQVRPVKTSVSVPTRPAGP